MTERSADYDAVRRAKHSPFGDSMARVRRDPFTAGAQHALDRLLNEVERVFVAPITREIVDRLAAGVLDEVHDLTDVIPPAATDRPNA